MERVEASRLQMLTKIINTEGICWACGTKQIESGKAQSEKYCRRRCKPRGKITAKEMKKSKRREQRWLVGVKTVHWGRIIGAKWVLTEGCVLSKLLL